MSHVEFVKELVDRGDARVWVAVDARVVSYDKKKLTATVTPLINTPDSANGKSFSPYPDLPDLPVAVISAGGYEIRPDYKTGDPVTVEFSAHGHGRGERVNAVETSDIHSKTNALVRPGIAPSGEAPDHYDDDGLIIGQRDGKARMRVADDAIEFVFEKDGQKTAMTLDQTGFNLEKDGQKFELFNHAHQYKNTPPSTTESPVKVPAP